uniref:Uncharacterized protein AlNc14C106G6226 n=1 Tax=Albugo laibachii Nc14 TaxID=890382 RepID=F0WI19_9STRA|nr:conserved hypothetical protein [Albugo laibachii Nc14]|eukprot:CCA20896.1 conserved hypothetical protein [Albugo laibachii Nc14]
MKMDAKVQKTLSEWKSATCCLQFASAARNSHPETPHTMSLDCNPLHRNSFLERVATFSIANWFAKPPVINVYQAARHGWSNFAADSLKCCCCDAVLCFSIDSKLTNDGVDRVAKRYAALLMKGHHHHCPWRDNPSPTAFTMLPVRTATERVRQLVENVTAFSAIVRAIDLEDPSNKWLGWFLDRDRWDFTASVWSKVSRHVLSIEDQKPHASSPDREIGIRSAKSIETKAFVLALHGWKLQQMQDKEESVYFLWCSYCNRRQLLDVNIKPEEMSDPLEHMMKDSESYTDAKRSCTNQRFLTQCRDHRWFCAWIRGGVESGQNRQPGWKECVQAFRSVLSTMDTEAIGDDESTKRKPMKPEYALEKVQSLLRATKNTF